jgi:hypothetical protein
MDSGHIPIRRHGIRDVESYEVKAEELEFIERVGSDIGFDFQVAQFCITSAVCFLVGLILSPPPPDARKTFDFLVLMIIVGFAIGTIFGIKWYRNRGSFATKIQEIKERPVIPVGDEHHPMRPSELAGLPSVEPPSQENER